MKQALLLTGVILFAVSGCKKDSAAPTLKINDLLGKWESLDSSMVQNAQGQTVFVHDTLFFTTEPYTNVCGQRYASPVLLRHGSKFGEYLFAINNPDTLSLQWIGMEKIFSFSKHKIHIENKVLTLQNASNFYPSTSFSRYRRME